MKTQPFTLAAALVLLAGSAQALAAGPFPAHIFLSSLLPANGGDGSVGFVLNGIDSVDDSGSSVSSAGDINGDGIDDIIIGAVGSNPNGQYRAGESYVVFGAINVGAGGIFNISTLNGSNGFVLNGIKANDNSGQTVSSAGDVNGDGIGDLIIGALYADPNGQNAAGESYVVFGGPNVGTGSFINLSSLNGVNGFVLRGIDPVDLSGISVSSAGDVNADGIDDIIIGAHLADPNGQNSAGESYIVFGAANLGAGGVINLSSLNGVNGFIINGVDTSDYSGFSVSSAGDINGDGIDDIIIGALGANPRGHPTGAGAAYVVFGAVNLGVGGIINLSSLNGANGFLLEGIDGNDHNGASVSSAGDVNGDGIDDLIIGADHARNVSQYVGETYIVFGATALGAGGVFHLSSLNGANGFIMQGAALGDLTGHSVSSAGDINGDGFADVVIGAPFLNHGPLSAGKTYVVFGAPNIGASGFMNLSTLNIGYGITLKGINQRDCSGFSVSSAGDINGDGVADFIIGAPFAAPNGLYKAGESYVVFGRGPNPADLNGDGVVGASDVSTLTGSWGACPPAPAACAADLTGDGVVNAFDLAQLIGSWGP